MKNSNSVRSRALIASKKQACSDSELEGRPQALQGQHKSHPLASDLTNMLRKVTGIDSLVERVVDRIGENLEQVWILGSLAQGINSDELEVLLIGQNLDKDYIKELLSKVEKHIDKTIKYQIKY